MTTNTVPTKRVKIQNVLVKSYLVLGIVAALITLMAAIIVVTYFTPFTAGFFVSFALFTTLSFIACKKIAAVNSTD
jgi:hypothetical protein